MGTKRYIIEESSDFIDYDFKTLVGYVYIKEVNDIETLTRAEKYEIFEKEKERIYLENTKIFPQQIGKTNKNNHHH